MEQFKSDHTNEAILDRIVKIEIPYCLELNEEIKIYEKILKEHVQGAYSASYHRGRVNVCHNDEAAPLQGRSHDKAPKCTTARKSSKGMTRKIDIMGLKEEVSVKE